MWLWLTLCTGQLNNCNWRKITKRFLSFQWSWQGFIPHLYGNSSKSSQFVGKSYQTAQTSHDPTNANWTCSVCENKHQQMPTGSTRWPYKTQHLLEVYWSLLWTRLYILTFTLLSKVTYEWGKKIIQCLTNDKIYNNRRLFCNDWIL